MTAAADNLFARWTGEPVSAYLANLFGLRFVLGREGLDPCDEWEIEALLSYPEGLEYREGRAKFSCRVCDAWTDWDGEPGDFEDGHYANVCGGSPRCCP